MESQPFGQVLFIDADYLLADRAYDTDAIVKQAQKTCMEGDLTEEKP